MIRKALFNTIIYGIGPQIPKFASLLILPLITQHLTASDFGIYAVVQAYGLSLSYLKTLGTDVVLTNVFFKHPRKYKTVWKHIGGMLHYWALFLSVIFGVIIFFVVDDKTFIAETILLNCIPLAFFTTTENQFFKFYQLQQRPIPITNRIIVTGLVNVAVTYFTIRTLGLGYRGWFYGTFVASLVGFLWMIYPIYVKEQLTPVFRLRRKYLKRTLSISLPILPHYYGNYLLSSCDRIVLDLMKVSNDTLGRYNAAYLFGNYFTILSTATKRSISPILQAYYAKQNWKSAKKMIYYWAGAFLMGTTLFSIWTAEIIPFFIRTAGMENIYGISIWVIMATNHVPMYVGANSQLFFYERTTVLWKRALVACVINIGLNLIFIPFWGIYAAAVNTFIAYLYLGYSSYWMKGYREIKKVELRPGRWLALTIAATLLSLALVELPIFLKAIISGVFLLVLSYFAHMIWKTRRDYLKQKSKKKVGVPETGMSPTNEI